MLFLSKIAIGKICSIHAPIKISYSILRVRPKPPKSAGTRRKGLPLVNVLFHTCDRSLLVVQLRTAFVHFAAFKSSFPGPPNFREFGKTGALNSR